jgi:Rps23 Pro-64 3,4-dihydroxylase Tpa1-like proline 4-hydroxylase
MSPAHVSAWSLSLSPGFAAEVRREYEQASPWSHVVLSGLFPDELIDRAAQESLEIQSSQLSVTADRNQMKDETGGVGPIGAEILRQLEQPAFIDFVSQVTGIADLVADPSHQWAGLHRTPPGGFTLVHRDFRAHPVTQLHHRVNVLLYLNRDWPQEYGGTLELWPSDMRAVGKSIRPLANTLVLFETNDQTLHGLPDPVACPPDQARLALACYYYTAAPRPRDVPVRRPVYARRPQDGFFVGRRGPVPVIRDLTPERAKRVFRRLRATLRRRLR